MVVLGKAMAATFDGDEASSLVGEGDGLNLDLALCLFDQAVFGVLGQVPYLDRAVGAARRQAQPVDAE